MTTPTSTIWLNNLKTVLLLGALTALFVVVGAQWGRAGMTIALIFGAGVNLAAWFFSDRIAIAAMRGREVDARTAPDLVGMVDRLRRQAGLPMPRVYLCPHDAPNAFATGRSPRKAAVAVTQGALRLLDERELEGVIAHELAHIRHRDTLISCVAATIAGVLAWVAQWGFFMMGGRREGQNPLVMILTVIVAAVAAAMIKSMISRSREFAADAGGAEIAGTPDGLISALAKLDAYSRRVPLVQPNPAQNNLFIVEPFGGSRTLLSLFATHPPTEIRIRRLESLRTG
ncbi:MAG: protease HtpX [Planctomycetota bacterium]|nr:MAG: protease HtpX [Planctomycetota bacterium]